MNDSARMALLPNGLRDILPPHAEHEAGVLAGLCACFAGRGFDRVEPPLVEFEDALLQGGGDIASQTFRRGFSVLQQRSQISCHPGTMRSIGNPGSRRVSQGVPG